MLNAKDKAALQEIAMFSDLSNDQLTYLGEILHRRTFAAGIYVLNEHQPGDIVYFINSGTIKIQIDLLDEKDVILNIVGAGEVLGEMSIIDGLDRSANAITLETCVLFGMLGDDFKHCLQTMPGLSYNLARVFSRRLRLATARIQMLATQDVYGRVAHQILAFADIYGETAADGSTRIPVRLTQTDLAHLVGATRVRVNQAMVSFKHLDQVAVDTKHRITVLNAKALAERCK